MQCRFRVLHWWKRLGRPRATRTPHVHPMSSTPTLGCAGFLQSYHPCTRTRYSLIRTFRTAADTVPLWMQWTVNDNSTGMKWIWKLPVSLTQFGVFDDVVGPLTWSTRLAEVPCECGSFDFGRRCAFSTVNSVHAAFEVLQKTLGPAMSFIVEISRMADIWVTQAVNAVLVIRSNHHHRLEIIGSCKHSVFSV